MPSDRDSEKESLPSWEIYGKRAASDSQEAMERERREDAGRALVSYIRAEKGYKAAYQEALDGGLKDIARHYRNCQINMSHRRTQLTKRTSVREDAGKVYIIPKEHHEARSLDDIAYGSAAVASIIGLVGGLALIYNMTGNVIANTSTSRIVGAVLSIMGVIAASIYLRRKTNKPETTKKISKTKKKRKK